MKKFLNVMLLAVLMLFSVQSASAQMNETAREKFVPAKVTLVGDGFDMVKNVEVYCCIDTLFNQVDFQVRTPETTSEMIAFHVEYVSCTEAESGFVLHLDGKSTLVFEDVLVGKACKLTIPIENEDFTKMVFVFYLIE